MKPLFLSKSTFAVACIVLSVGAGVSIHAMAANSTAPAVDGDETPVTIDGLQKRSCEKCGVVAVSSILEG